MYNGGSEVTQYQVQYSVRDSGVWTLFASGTTQLHQTVTGLTPGVTYSFRVKALNVVNYSVYSSSINVLAAQEPDAPTLLRNVPEKTSRSTIGLAWDAPSFNGGSPLIDYRLWTDESGGSFV